MANPIAMLPQSVPFLMNNGLISTQWYMFLNFLYIRAGGAIADSNTDLQALIDTAPMQQVADFSDQIDQINQCMSGYASAIETMIDELNLAPIAQVSLNDYDPAAVAITGGSIDGAGIGATTPANGKFVALTTGESAQILSTSIAATDYSGAAVGTLTNSPTAGNPTKWCAFNDNGTLRKFPTW